MAVTQAELVTRTGQASKVRPPEVVCTIGRGPSSHIYGAPMDGNSLGHYTVGFRQRNDGSWVEQRKLPTVQHLRARVGGWTGDRIAGLITTEIWSRLRCEPDDLGPGTFERLVKDAVWAVHRNDRLPKEAARFVVDEHLPNPVARLRGVSIGVSW